MSRFDYVRYDELSFKISASAKENCEQLEAIIKAAADVKVPMTEHTIKARRLALEKLEECYMWIGKMLRDIQLHRNGSAQLQEERHDG